MFFLHKHDSAIDQYLPSAMLVRCNNISKYGASHSFSATAELLVSVFILLVYL